MCRDLKSLLATPRAVATSGFERSSAVLQRHVKRATTTVGLGFRADVHHPIQCNLRVCRLTKIFAGKMIVNKKFNDVVRKHRKS